MPVLGDPEHIMQIFCQAPIRVQDNGDCRRERTVGAVVMMPREGVLHLRCGDPAQAMVHALQKLSPRRFIALAQSHDQESHVSGCFTVH